ncbi:MAG TPA: hypothetical protein VN864_02295 [Thermoplasmata archaeon]|nr:hypothetical protein [Thermoplasmata archaeon]
MGEPPAAAQAHFEKLIVQLAEDAGTDGPRRKGFASHSMFVGRKMFAILDESGALVVKLPPERVAGLIASGAGSGWSPGHGSPLKEYLAVGFDRKARWLSLAKESRTFMASKG